MNRRSFLMLSGGALCGQATFGRTPSSQNPQPNLTRQQPNVIFILVDDLGFGDLGVTFQKQRSAMAKLTTPHLDRFAAEGTMLTDHYSSAPVCAPSRASLITGKSQGHCTLRDNQFDRPIETRLTLGSLMKAAGYATFAVGKWGMGGGGESGIPITGAPRQIGFDHSFVYMKHRDGHSYYHAEQDRPILEDDRIVPNDIQRFRYDTDLLTARAERYISDHLAQHPKQPFFMFLAYTAIHGSYTLPKTGIAKTPFHVPGRPFEPIQGQWPLPAEQPTLSNTWIHPDYSKKQGFTTPPMRRYATTIRRLDDNIGDLITYLKYLGIDEQTMIVFTSDNGPANEQTANPETFESWGPFRGLKRWIIDGGIHAPTLVRWPDVIPTGRVDRNPSQFQCWMPTLAEIAGVPQPIHSDGVSILPAITGQGKQRPCRIYSEYRSTAYGLSQQQYLREGDYCAVRQKIKTAKDPIQLYNIRKDPRQQNDLMLHPMTASLKQLAKHLADAMINNRIPVSATLAACGTKGYIDKPRPYDHAPYRATSQKRPHQILWFTKPTFCPWTPDVTTLPLASSCITRPQGQPCCALLQGTLHVPKTAIYSVSVKTSGSCHLIVHEARVIQYEEPGTYTVKIPLEQGFHPYALHTLLPKDGVITLSLKGHLVTGTPST